MTITGGCHCGAVRYEAEGQPQHNALCHCTDCRRSAGAPAVGWALFPQAKVTIKGSPTRYNSSGDVDRQFCGTCGTGLFFYSESLFPGMVDIQAATFDDPDALAPSACIQMADAPKWLATVADLPKFDRYPGM
ncbi:GFA family protein [Sphingomonas sp.]|uniref:GFA family protein n=1 Tax=Sphingomonas sp. TaxID=28214 RepID=UPI002DD619BB|nr:GFA family protein [Sphingomonas sp.]